MTRHALCAILIAITPLLTCFGVPALAQVSGTVKDELTLAPLAGARVGVQATDIYTFTDDNGFFDLPNATGSDLIVVAGMRWYFYEPAVIDAPAVGVEFLMELVPQQNDPNYQFITHYTCGMCHPVQQEQFEESSMTHTGANRWVYDFYNGTGTAGGGNGFVYTRDSAHAAHNPGSECASCHQPESWIKQPFRALEDINNLSANARHGVSCEVCHKIADVDETKLNHPGIYPGAVQVTLPYIGTPTQVEYGVFGDCDYEEPYIMRGAYQPELTTTMCASCHQDKNDPDQDGDFEEANGVSSQSTYTEWRDSPYGDPQSGRYTTCVDCHMPSFGDSTAAETIMDPDQTIRDPSTVRHHNVEGVEGYLDWASRVEVSGETAGESLHARVIVTNAHAGHNIPTGGPLRNLVLLVRAWRLEDGEDLPHTGSQTIHELGGIGDPAQGYYAGLPGKLFARVLTDANGEWPAFYTEATGVLFDTRIAPLHSDTTHYSFALPQGGGTIAVNARLIYRRAPRSVIDEKGWTQTGLGEPLVDLAPPYFGYLMEEGGWMSGAASVGQEAFEDRAPTLRSSPNPANPGTRFRIELPEGGQIRLAIYDAGGRLVAEPVDRFLVGGVHWISWDGNDRSGGETPSGVYHCLLEVDGRKRQESPLVLVR